MKIIDLRSDTVTLPTEDMRRAMYEAELGDDVYREDPTVNKLEALSAEMLGKEAALFTVSGTMSNLIAVLTHCHPGDEIILGSESHMFWYEVGGASAVGGVVMRTVTNDQDGRIDPATLEQAIRPENIHYPSTTLLCLENTHNRCGGIVLTPEYTSSVSNIAHENGLKVHLDGARIFNAAVALNMPVSELAKTADSVCFCLSKGLGAPVGSVLCGTKRDIEKGRKWRKMLGGGMRQAGVIAAGGLFALQKMVIRLEEDHANARRLANGLAHIPGIVINLAKVQTNMVMFEPPTRISVFQFIECLDAQGIKVISHDGRRLRAVTHCNIKATDIDDTLNRIEIAVRELI